MRPLVAALLLGVLGGCAPWDVSEEDGLRVLRRSASFGSDGKVVLDVDVEDGETALLATTVVRSGANAYVDRVIAPSGEVFRAEDWWDADRNKTNAAYASEVVDLNWPVSAEDPPLVPGHWRIVVRAASNAGTADFTVALKPDADLTAGTVVAQVAYAGNLEADEALVAGVDAALARWADEIYGPAGIEVAVEPADWDGPDELASPGFGDPRLYEDAVGGKDLRVVPVLLVRWISDGTDVFGVSGGIPGPLVGTDRSAVTISLGEAAGTDLRFDDTEIGLLSETMAHEVGHYLGLFHPVEIPRTGDRATTWDALDDTPECATFTRACLDRLGENLMFPTPVCTQDDGVDCTGWVPQTALTADQEGVLNRYVGVE